MRHATIYIIIIIIIVLKQTAHPTRSCQMPKTNLAVEQYCSAANPNP